MNELVKNDFPLFEEIDHKKLVSDSFRCRSTKDSLRLVMKKIRHLGITRISDITDLDHIGIPVISAIRPAVSDLQITATQGKGLKKIDAYVSALMEAVERFSLGNFSEFTTAPQGELIRENINFLHPNLLGCKVNQDSVLDWVKSTCLSSGASYLVPAADVVFPYTPKPGITRPVRPSTTGASSGNTKAEALLHAMFEVIERDTVSKFFIGGSASIVDLNSIESKSEQNLIVRFQNAGLDILALDLSALSPIPVYYVSILNTKGIGPDIACAGQGAHLNPCIAFRRALTEAAQSRAVAIQGSREDLIRHASDWKGSHEQFTAMRNQIKIQALHSGGITSLTENLKNSFSIKEALQLLQKKLAASGYNKIFYTDLTHPTIQIPVIHTIIPGLTDNIVEPSRLRVLPRDLHRLH